MAFRLLHDARFAVEFVDSPVLRRFSWLALNNSCVVLHMLNGGDAFFLTGFVLYGCFNHVGSVFLFYEFVPLTLGVFVFAHGSIAHGPFG